MHANRIECPCLAIVTETQRIVVMLLLTESGPFSRAELA